MSVENNYPITEDLIADHGITPDEYEKILELTEREPSYTELGIWSAMWNEHCSYKSSKIHLKTLPTKNKRVIQGPGENAGVIDIGDDDAIGAGIYSGYNFTERLGIELSSDFLGDYKTSFSKNGTTSSFSDPLIAISLTPMYRLPVQQEFDVFFKAGPAYISHGGEDDVVFAAGIGLEKQLSSNWAVRAEYQYFDDFDDNYVQDLNSNLLSVGVSYNFGTGNTTASAAAAAASAVAVTQAPSEPITEPAVVVEEKTTVVVTKAQTESFSQGTFATNSTELSEEGKTAVQPISVSNRNVSDVNVNLQAQGLNVTSSSVKSQGGNINLGVNSLGAL